MTERNRCEKRINNRDNRTVSLSRCLLFPAKPLTSDHSFTIMSERMVSCVLKGMMARDIRASQALISGNAASRAGVEERLESSGSPFGQIAQIMTNLPGEAFYLAPSAGAKGRE